MRIAVAGSQGLIGNALVNSLRAAGHTVIRLVRREALDDDEFSWDPETIGLPPATLDGVDAVVSLGGVGVGNGRWTGRFKQELRDSRITPTEVLAEAVRDHRIPIFISASATGFYGDTGDRAAVETDPPGEGFLAELVVDWEKAATANAGDARVVLLRTAPVLSATGGMLAKLLPLFRLGLGGPIGSGAQWFSWISLIDEVRAIEFLLDSDISGPVNLASPGAVTFGEFCTALGKAVRRPAVFRVPEFLARTFGGEMAEEMILFSQRVEPRVLTDHGFTFTHPDIRRALDYATKPAS
ncbi:TIGR01777 family oxidoreductase [Gordonia aurantiaca]|uniref:TIGR01777 family oxidoreductase n=1 Tax=Gordonia sp. B21 TaxID=3151852 RepID=UPI00326543F6